MYVVAKSAAVSAVVSSAAHGKSSSMKKKNTLDGDRTRGHGIKGPALYH